MQATDPHDDYEAAYRECRDELLSDVEDVNLMAAHSRHDAELQATLTSILQRLPPYAPEDPKEAFLASLSSLHEIDARRFVLENFLEGIKRGEARGTLEERFTRLGLLRSAENAQDDEDAQDDDTTEPEDDASSSTRSLHILKRWAYTISEIAIASVRAIPDYVEIKPKLSFTLGMFPSPSFELAGKGKTWRDFMETIRKAHTHHRVAR